MYWSLLALTLATILSVPAAFSQPRQAKGSPDTIGIVVSPEQSQFALNRLALTDAELANATPMGPIALEGTPQQSGITRQVAPRSPVEIPGAGSHPDAALTRVWASLAEKSVTALAPSTDYYAYTPPFTAYRVNSYGKMWNHPPWKTMGKLYWTNGSSGGRFYCTAAVGQTRVAWTAGHCVADGGQERWHRDLVFYPAIRTLAGATWKPYGDWSVRRMATTRAWFEQGDLKYDIAMFSMYDQLGEAISYYTGYLGFSYDQSNEQHYNAFGYPTNLDSGALLWSCQGSTSSTDAAMDGSPNPVGMGCSMGKGSSGGPRLFRYASHATGATNYVNGVNSYFYTAKPQEVYSSYFGATANTLYTWGKAQ